MKFQKHFFIFICFSLQHKIPCCIVRLSSNRSIKKQFALKFIFLYIYTFVCVMVPVR